MCDGYDNCGNRWAASGKDERNCELGTLFELKFISIFPFVYIIIAYDSYSLVICLTKKERKFIVVLQNYVAMRHLN